MPTPDVEVALGFLGNLYAASDGAGWLNLFGIDRRNGQRSTAWAQLANLEQLAGDITRLGSYGDLWFGVAPRSEQLDGGRRGGGAHCLSIPALWLDVDIAGAAHHAAGLPQSRQEAVQLVQLYSRRPEAVVSSGYGLQCWWSLSEPLLAAEATVALDRWRITWEGLCDGLGLKIDNVFNIDRIMRLPGSFNFKGPEPVSVTVREDWNIRAI